MSTDLTFLTNESGHSLLDRFNVLLKEDILIKEEIEIVERAGEGVGK